jgi:cell division septation protein DedD
MDSGRDLDDRREPAPLSDARRALWQARWFRATVVFSIAALTAALTVPYVLDRAARHAVVAPGPARQASPVAVIPDVATLAWEGGSESAGETMPSGGFAAIPIARGPVIRKVSASAPAAPKRTEPAPAQGSPRGSKTAPEGTGAAGTGDLYWVQVGAFRDAETARRVAQRLREHKYQVQESVTTRPAPATAGAAADVAPVAQGERDRYEIVVTGGSAAEVEAKLSAKGLTSRAAAEGSVITPGLPLGEAVALSKDLADAGLAVRVRRVGTSAGAAPRSPNRPATETLHRVRVGGFADRGAAVAVLKDLESRGYKPFLGRGNE